ncbi:MAG: serine hydrolase, partial [Candidatus Eremiobacteraeota bacterium]|nr:serine hydrolase [Candidatus Eremiobacteraeota bacterium]
MKRVVAGLLAAIFAASVGGVAIAQTNSAADAELATNIGSRVKDVTGVGIVAGTIVFGSSNTIVAGSTGGSASLDADTVFEIGSITKTFTATVLADMVRRGEVALDDPIEKYLPAGSTGPTFNGAHVTLLDLATQSSGLPRMPTNFAPANRDNPYVDYAQPQLYGFLGSYQLTRAPGSKYEYSNVGFGLLGQLLANRVKTTYEALVQARLLAILAMTSTGITLSPAMREHLAPGRDVDGNPAGNWDLGALAGAGAIRSSMRDMLKYLAANMNGSGPIGEDAKMAQTPR